jgi:hypothetical protein
MFGCGQSRRKSPAAGNPRVPGILLGAALGYSAGNREWTRETRR